MPLPHALELKALALTIRGFWPIQVCRELVATGVEQEILEPVVAQTDAHPLDLVGFMQSTGIDARTILEAKRTGAALLRKNGKGR